MSLRGDLLQDTFHAQQINGQLGATLRKLKDHIGYIQVAQVPNRGACDTMGEINYQFIFEEIRSINPNWVIGAEYSDAEGADFQWIQKMAVEF